MKIFSNIDEIQAFFCDQILSKGETVETRGLKTKEIFPVSFALKYPRNRCTTNPARKWSLPLALGELAWHLNGRDQVEDLTYYAGNWKKFSDGYCVVESCYGKKIFSGSESQWNRVKSLLVEDQNSRRAVLNFFTSSKNLNAKSVDIACTLSMQFLLRKGKLDVITTMRSNDLIWGIPYDIFLFTMLQELMAMELNVEVGTYYHNVGSMHIYDYHYNLAESIRDIRVNSSFEMPVMESLRGVEEFLCYESFLRNKTEVDVNNCSSNYFKELIKVLEFFNAKKRGERTRAISLARNTLYQEVLEPIY